MAEYAKAQRALEGRETLAFVAADPDNPTVRELDQVVRWTEWGSRVEREVLGAAPRPPRRERRSVEKVAWAAFHVAHGDRQNHSVPLPGWVPELVDDDEHEVSRPFHTLRGEGRNSLEQHDSASFLAPGRSLADLAEVDALSAGLCSIVGAMKTTTTDDEGREVEHTINVPWADPVANPKWGRFQALREAIRSTHDEHHYVVYDPLCDRCVDVEIALRRLVARVVRDGWRVTPATFALPVSEAEALLNAPAPYEGQGASISFVDLAAEPEPLSWWAEGMIPSGSVVIVASEPNVGKSHLALAACLDRAGLGWAGDETVLPKSSEALYAHDGPALYFAAEGARGIPSRIAAYRANRADLDCDDDLETLVSGIRVAPMIPNLFSPGESFTEALTLVSEQRPSLIVLDMLTLAMLGADQNSAGDVSTVMSNVRRLRDAGDQHATVLALMHSPKAGPGVRGSSAFTGEADAVLHLARHGAGVRVKVTKARDAEIGATFDYEIATHGSGASLVRARTDKDVRLVADAVADLVDLLDQRQWPTSTGWNKTSDHARRFLDWTGSDATVKEAVKRRRERAQVDPAYAAEMSQTSTERPVDEPVDDSTSDAADQPGGEPDGE